MRQVIQVSIEGGRGHGAVVCERCELAASPWTRMRGLLGRRSLDPESGLMLRPASAIHMFFMRFSIDAVFLDPELSVIGIRTRLRPWRAAAVRGANVVLELAAGETERRGVAVGQRLRVETVGGTG